MENEAIVRKYVQINDANRQNLPLIGNHGNTDNSSSNKKSSYSSFSDPCEESIYGHFGWVQLGKVLIPYIFRQSEKYCSVRMIEQKILGQYLDFLHSDFYSSCSCVPSYYITDAEARLFNEINQCHCDGQFGPDIFNQKDLIVRLSDASQLNLFLAICYRKLVSDIKNPSEKCGFLRINKESVVPYTVHNNQQVVPFFYFEAYLGHAPMFCLQQLCAIPGPWKTFPCGVRRRRRRSFCVCLDCTLRADRADE
ncbi:uncharacterized protein [Drosophila takahashii]|uniref:uncharacterized protein isoform X1 n=1 Tax=Drosophila takahashii TaxID=29030 RepID=UPI003898DAB3